MDSSLIGLIGRRRNEESHKRFDSLTLVVAGKRTKANIYVGISLIILRMIFIELLDANINEVFILGLMLGLKEVYEIHTLVVLQSIL